MLLGSMLTPDGDVLFHFVSRLFWVDQRNVTGLDSPLTDNIFWATSL
jgi:hypothetical protein